MGGGATASGGRATRALRLLLLVILALAAVEYLFGSILDASPLKTYLYTPLYNATQPTKLGDKPQTTWPKKLVSATQRNPTSKDLDRTTNFTIVNNTRVNLTDTKEVLDHRIPGSNIEEKNMVVSEKSNDSTPLLISKIMEGIKNAATTEAGVAKTDAPLPLCPNEPQDLGPIPVNKTDLELEWVDKKFPEIRYGGRYSPPNCTARHKVAIIVPYRDREQHLAIFLNHMHPFLMKQQIEYGIFVVEQNGKKEFNRAKLMNVGFAESQRLEAGGWQCFIFHDIDLLPLDTRNMYSCPKQPRHMSVSIDKLGFKLPYEDIFGGVSALTQEQFTKVNGFSNKYWGWGGEDDDMSYRLKKNNYHIARYKMSVARYAMLDHKKSVPNPKRYQLLSQTSKTFRLDGLSTLEYELVQIVHFRLYTYILVNIDERS